MKWTKPRLVRIPQLWQKLIREIMALLRKNHVVKDNMAALAQALADIEIQLLSPDGSCRTERLTSRLCTQEQFADLQYAYWCKQFHNRVTWHRKQWELYFVCRSLSEYDMLRPGVRGLGFGVGKEPLPALFASRGVKLVATDQESEQAKESGWARRGQHASGYQTLPRTGFCDEETFARLVSFRVVNMNSVPEGLRDFDFLWSTCALEHVGNLRLAKQFIYNAMACLRPGGIAVHTTEYTLSSNEHTIEAGPTVLFRRRDIEEVVSELELNGHCVSPVDFSTGEGILDHYVDVRPYRVEPHLRLLIGKHVCTSIGLIIRKGN